MCNLRSRHAACTFGVGGESHVMIDSLAPRDQENGDGVVVVAHVPMVDRRDVTRSWEILARSGHTRGIDA